jgi:hypothetical protein
MKAQLDLGADGPVIKFLGESLGLFSGRIMVRRAVRNRKIVPVFSQPP